MPNIYVLAKSGKPLMPIHKYGRARRLLKSGEAHIACYKPFAIQLTYDIENPVTDDVILGVDPGRTNIGLTAVNSRGKVLYAAETITRNKEVAKLMLHRKQMRQASRRGERKKRQRRAIASDKTGMAKHTEFWRMLPGCKEPICCKHIRNTEARFNNRTRAAGWLTPSARQLKETHINCIKLIQKILPVTCVVVEINVFDFARMENPKIRNWEYQKGRLFGYDSRDEAVAEQQKHKCLLCGEADIEQFHHIVPKSRGGSESIDNIAGLCTSCHEQVHKNDRAAGKLKEKKEGILKKYHALSLINQIMEMLLKELSEILPTYVTTGYETKSIQEKLQLPKKHFMDAYCIALSFFKELPEPDVIGEMYHIIQFRRHDRAIINNQRERTYFYDGKMIAKNRKPRFEQKGDALSDWFDKQVELYGERRAMHMLSRVNVKKSTRYYNSDKRLMPGTVFVHNGERHVMSGQISGGLYLRAVGDRKTNYPRRDCRVVSQNAGLVYL